MLHEDIKKLTKENPNFRQVVYTGDWSQLVLMCIAPGEEIGEEVHHGVDQILFLVEGEGQAILEGETTPFKKHDVVFVPAGTKHNFVNTGDEDLKLYTVYSPPEHAYGTVHRTKADAEKAEEEHKRVEVTAHDIFDNL